MAPARPKLAGSRHHNVWKQKHLCRPQPSWAVSGPGGLEFELACGTQDQKRGGARKLRDRKGTPKNFCDKDFAELSGELSGAICLKTPF